MEVIEGELQNLQGKVIKIEGSKITLMPKHDDLKDLLDFQASELKKYFKQVKSLIYHYFQQFLHDSFFRETTSESLEEDMRETQD